MRPRSPKNRDRLLEGEGEAAFFAEVVAEATTAGLVSDEHFTVDGTLLEAWASHKSFKRRDTPPEIPDDPGNPTINFRGESRKNETHSRPPIRMPACTIRARAVLHSWRTPATSAIPVYLDDGRNGSGELLIPETSEPHSLYFRDDWSGEVYPVA